MERIKLIESEKLIEILKRYYPFYGDTELYATQDVIDECERRATEKIKEAFERGQESILLYPKEQRPTFQQFLKEQDGKDSSNYTTAKIQEEQDGE